MQLSGQSLNLNPTRPTIANSATIQDKGVLQVELGYDAYPQRVPGNQQTVGVSVYYALTKQLRLDFGWSALSHQGGEGAGATGVGTIQAGGKVVLYQENYHRAAPGLGLQYEAELPTASDAALENKGQQIILELNHHYGRDGILDVIANGSLVQSGCQAPSDCSYGGQQSLALSYHLRERTRLYAEVFSQNNAESNTPPGTYVFGGFFQRCRDDLGIDGGLRFGVTDRAASVGATLGLVFGKRLAEGTSLPKGPKGR